MRIAGILLLLLALAWLGYALFALAWDGGTARATDDRIMAGLAVALAIGAIGMIGRQSWGWMVCTGVAAVVVVGLVLAALARPAQRPAPVAGPASLQSLPQAEQPRSAGVGGPPPSKRSAIASGATTPSRATGRSRVMTASACSSSLT